MRTLLASIVTALVVSLSVTTVAAPAEASPKSQAVRKAKDYLAYSPFSKLGLRDQLEFEGFSRRNANYAVNKIRVNWKKQAVRKAKDYLRYSSFSCEGLIEQLQFEKFTPSQASFGANRTDAC